nr:hypothetical protein [Geotalea toluenoxydans]
MFIGTRLTALAPGVLNSLQTTAAAGTDGTVPFPMESLQGKAPQGQKRFVQAIIFRRIERFGNIWCRENLIFPGDNSIDGAVLPGAEAEWFALRLKPRRKGPFVQENRSLFLFYDHCIALDNDPVPRSASQPISGAGKRKAILYDFAVKRQVDCRWIFQFFLRWRFLTAYPPIEPGATTCKGRHIKNGGI